MVDIQQINLAIKIAGEEYRKVNAVKVVDDIHGLLEADTAVCREILRLSEQYLHNHINNPQILEESLTYLRSYMILDEENIKKESVNKYLKLSNQLG